MVTRILKTLTALFFLGLLVLFCDYLVGRVKQLENEMLQHTGDIGMLFDLAKDAEEKNL